MKEVKQQHMVFTNMSSLFSRYADAIHKNQPQAEAAFPLLLPLASSHLCTHQCSVFLLPIWGLHCVKVLKTFQANRTAHIFSLKMGKYILPSITALMWDKVGYFGCVWAAWWRTVTRTICCAEQLLQFHRDMVPSTHPRLSLGSLLGLQLLGTFCSHSLLCFNQLFTLTSFRHTFSLIFMQPHTTL